MFYSESNPSVCVSLPIAQLCTLSIKLLGHENQKSNKKNSLPLMIFGCFHSRDSQLHNKCSFCSINIFIPKIPTFVCRVMFRNPQERAVTTTQTYIPNNIYNVHRNMSNVFLWSIFRLFLKYIFDNISTECVAFSITAGGTMAALLNCAQTHSESPHLSTYAMWSFTLSFPNNSLKLCLKTVDTLGKPHKKESGWYPFKWRTGTHRNTDVSK